MAVINSPPFDIQTFLNLLAGVSLGLCVGSGVLCVYLLKRIKSLDAERMKLWNKLLVRDAQAPLFSEKEITSEEPEKHEKPQPVQATTPFRKGLKNLHEKVRSRKPSTLPDDVTMPIVAAAQEVKEAA